MVIGIDAGHGSKDPGAVGLKGTKESDVAFAVALDCIKYLIGSGVSAGMLRTAGENLKAIERIKRASQYNLVVSIHCNAAENRSVWGTEVIYGEKFQENKNLATCVERYMAATVGKSRGIKVSPSAKYPRDLFMCNRLIVPSCLVEIDFISNPDRETWLVHNIDDCARAISQGIFDHVFGN